jgi:Ca2+-binding RTX toxin-like protein
MTTYTLTGLAVYYDNVTDNVVGVDNTDVTLEVVVPDSTTSLSYTVLPLAPGDLPGEGEEIVDISLDEYTLRVNGMTFGGDTGLDPEASIFEVTWKDASNITQTSTVLLPFFDQTIPVPGLGNVFPDYVFVINGAPLPTISSVAAWNAFEGKITAIDIPTGAYGPGVNIPLTSLGATVSENDIITGTGGNDVFDGGAGADKITGLGGDDILRGGVGNDKLFGGAGIDQLFGGGGNDLLNPGDNTFYDDITAGKGKDKVVLSDVSTGYVGLLHGDLAAKITVNIDGNANTGQIKKAGAGTTTIIDVKNPMMADGLAVNGTAFKDIFNVTVANGGWMQVRGSAGRDTFNIGTSTGQVRLDYRDATEGVIANLALNKVKNDGFGNVDTITGTGKVWEVRSGMFDDKITGSANDESFILMAGNDIVNGGGGFDKLRYDRTGVDGVRVDLEAGTAFGTWRGEAFSHTIKSIEHVRGSNGDDLLMAVDSKNTKLEGRDGDDVLEGALANDTLLGGNGKDKLWGDTGNDLLQGEAGNDLLKGEWGKDRLEGGDGKDKLDGGTGNDRLFGGAGNDKMIGGGGNDKMTGGGGNDIFVFGPGKDVITDFNVANNREKIDLSGVSSITSFKNLKNKHLNDVAGDAVIDDGNGNTLTLDGVGIGNLDKGDFIF